jgi:pimeloyl-ACP methyl ester carboxylesterase
MNATPTEARIDVSQAWPAMQFPWEAGSYGLDAVERWFLFLEVMRQRSERYRQQTAKLAPHVLKFDFELVMDGQKLPRPVNYVLVRMKPPAGADVDKRKRPFIIVDPRAGHGPGIGGFKADSEIGVAFQAGHPCYFIGFLPQPVPGQTIEDIVHATAIFIEHVGALHFKADGKPAVVGNCQAGWAVMMAAARRPELFGPLIIAGSPLSYWAGVRGENPMRYTGGLLGGSWLTALMADLGGGKFDGAWLVSNFENLNPANSLWGKNYNLYANIDKEAPRYLEFEQWWSAHALLNAEEMEFIVDELFIGNRLASTDIIFSDGARIDLRHIRSPIVIFCSKADNITPPAQALGWICDLYEDVDDIQAHGQTIVYAVHETAGHLGIFVSGSVARKEHQEFASNIDLIDVLPPGLYEAVITPAAGAGLAEGVYLARFEARTLDDIRAFGVNSDEDDRRFAAVERVSQVNLGLYRSLVQPWVRLFMNEGTAGWMRDFHPLRLQHAAFSSKNPLLPLISQAADAARENRHAVPAENALWQAQEQVSEHIETSLNAFRDLRDAWLEALFHGIYGASLSQAMAGLKASDASPRHRPGRDAMHGAFIALRREELRAGLANGGPREAVIRALLYIRLADGVADERGFRLMQQMRDETGSGIDLPAFKQMIRDQFFMLLIDEQAAIDAIPAMLATDPDFAAHLGASLRRVIDAAGVPSELGKARLAEMERLFEANDGIRGIKRTAGTPSPRPVRKALIAAGSGKDHS